MREGNRESHDLPPFAKLVRHFGSFGLRPDQIEPGISDSQYRYADQRTDRSCALSVLTNS